MLLVREDAAELGTNRAVAVKDEELYEAWIVERGVTHLRKARRVGRLLQQEVLGDVGARLSGRGVLFCLARSLRGGDLASGGGGALLPAGDQLAGNGDLVLREIKEP